MNQIHTSVPRTEKNPNFSEYNHYCSALKHVENSSAYSLKELSKVGAIVWLLFGGDSGEEPVQLTKKKIRWKDLVLQFYGSEVFHEEEKELKYLIDELKKHGLVLKEAK